MKKKNGGDDDDETTTNVPRLFNLPNCFSHVCFNVSIFRIVLFLELFKVLPSIIYICLSVIYNS